MWGGEKSMFIYGPFNDGSSTTGHWQDVGHYTQIVWHDTTECGCGKATHSSGQDFWVCSYNPPGNYWNQYPYPLVQQSRRYVGVFRGAGKWYLDYNGNGAWDGSGTDRLYTFGSTGDLPLSGDWDHDGLAEIGVFRPSTHTFYLDYNGNGAWNGAGTDRQYSFGANGDRPVAGDWDNDGFSEIGVFRSSTHTFYLDYNGNGAWNGAGTDRQYSFGANGDRPVAGDWDNDGFSEIGVFRSSTHSFYLDNNGNGVWNGVGTDKLYSFGAVGDMPVTGDWGNDGISEIGVFRSSTHSFYLDYSANGVWNGAGTDRQYSFGASGDKPVVGKWV